MKLQEMYNDGESLKEVRSYLKRFLAVRIVEKAIEKDSDAMALGVASKAVDEAFDDLDLQFRSKPKKTEPAPNEAR